MMFSLEAIFTLIGVLIALPALFVLMYNLWRRLHTKQPSQGSYSPLHTLKKTLLMQKLTNDDIKRHNRGCAS